MIWLAVVLTASAPSAVVDGPYKLVITWYQGGIVVVDYPNRTRCERAKMVVLEREIAKAARIGLPPESADIAFCIPG